jgi:hypothetical protein
MLDSCVRLAGFFRSDLISINNTLFLRKDNMSRLLLALLILISANAFAAVNKWVDAQGRIHYSDQPPPTSEVKAEALRSTSNTEGSAGTSAPAAPKTIAEREAELKKAQQAKQEAADKAAQKQAAEEIKKSNCAAAQQYLRSLQSGVRMMEVGPNGEQSIVTDEQRQQRLEKAQKDVSTHCK